MIYDKKSKSFRQLFYFYQKLYLFPRHFYSVCLRGEIHAITDAPTLYIANHSSWWDGLILFQVTESDTCGDHYIMMDEAQLARYSFFRKLGAFSVNKESAKGVLASLKYAEELLQQGKNVWLFPQGDIQPLEKRPLDFQQGIGFLLQRHPEMVVKPATFYYAFDDQQKPTASVWFGETVKKDWRTMNRTTITGHLEAIIEQQLNEHKQMVIEEPRYREVLFSNLTKAGKSTSDRLDAFKKGLNRW